jgi:hypothetical protein
MAVKEDKFKLPSPLLDYFRRIGAEVLNFRRAMVKEHRGNYYVERTLIKIGKDGKIEVTGNKGLEPTEAEEKEIEEALKDFKFPSSIGASESDTKAYIRAYANKIGNDVENFYIIRDRKAAKIAMIQERRPQEDGGKIFIPHSLWSDGEWRTQEPEGELPFWKPAMSSKVRIMVHEGAKAARYMDWMLNDRSPEAKAARESHPWSEELALYEHWGMLGGALAPHRAKYEELKREQPIEVVYVCDNDHPGRSVLQQFSSRVTIDVPVKGVKFDGRFKESFDLADAMPPQLFRSKGEARRWIGPTMKSLMRPATFATTAKAPSGKKGEKTSYHLKSIFREEWMHVVSPELFVHRDHPNDLIPVNEFNSRVRPFSHVEDTAKLLRRDAASKADKLHYMPGAKAGFFGDNDNGQYINTYMPSEIKPEKGDAEPWEDFLKKLILDDGDRFEVMRWVATLIARPDIKMMYGMLFISEMQGIGKTTLGERILKPILGNHNVSSPSEVDIVDSQFNSWLAHKRLAVINEIYAGASTKAYNKLKSVITDRYVTVNKKHQPTYDLENWIHVFACSNSPRALKLSVDDRRWFVPKLTEEKEPLSFWKKFYGWLDNEGGLGIIMQWAIDFVLDVKGGVVLPGENAPDSAAKRDMVMESYSPGMIFAADLLDEIAKKEAEDGAEYFVTDTQIIDQIKSKIYEGRHNERLERPGTIRKLAKSKGWFAGEIRTRRFTMPNNARVLSRHKKVAEADPSRLPLNEEKWIDFNDFNPIAVKWTPKLTEAQSRDLGSFSGVADKHSGRTIERNK